MNLEARKIEFVQEFLKLQSEEVISRLEKILKSEKSSHKKAIEPMSIEAFNLRIDRSMEDSENGKLISSDELKSQIDKWN